MKRIEKCIIKVDQPTPIGRYVFPLDTLHVLLDQLQEMISKQSLSVINGVLAEKTVPVDQMIGTVVGASLRNDALYLTMDIFDEHVIPEKDEIFFAYSLAGVGDVTNFVVQPNYTLLCVNRIRDAQSEPA